MEDIKKRSLKEILPKKGSIDSVKTTEPEFNNYSTNTNQAFIRNNRNKIPVKTISVVVILFLLILAGFSLSTVLAKSTIVVTPKQAKVDLSDFSTSSPFSIPLIKEASLDEEVVPFALIEKELVEETSVKPTEERSVSERARGQITVYNNFDQNPQILVATTRFETSDGKIYRIPDQITVPGKRGETPGSIDVTVIADEPGEEYNKGMVDFTIPGFKGSPRFEGFYAKSKTAMTGGFVGNIRTISNTERGRIISELESKLNQRRSTELNIDTPEGYVVLPEGIITSFKNSTPADDIKKDDGSISIKHTMLISAIIVKESDLAKYIANKSIPDYQNEDLYIANLTDLDITIKNRDSLDLNNRIEIEVIGSPNLVWKVDKDKLKQDLIGLTKNNYNEAISKHPSILRASVKMRPPWLWSIPSNPNKVIIDLQVD